MIPKKTPWCQHCVEEKELQLHTTAKGRTYWVCEECAVQLEEADRRGVQTKAPKKMRDEIEKADRLCAERMQTRSLKRRKVAPGERLPEARSDFGFGAVPLRREDTPMDAFVGFRWSYGWGPNEEE